MRGAERSEDEPTRPNIRLGGGPDVPSPLPAQMPRLHRVSRGAADEGAEVAASLVGRVLGGRYEVTRALGYGAMGAVLEVRHVGHGQRLALKLLHERYRDNAEAVARFTQESRAAARIRGEHAVRVHDVGTHDGLPFMVMELLQGHDLASAMEDGPLPFDRATLYILQACEGIAEVHAHGMVHRDLKPSNLFLTARPDGSPLVKVLDFGIAKNVHAEGEAALVHTQTFVALGTPLYMSPEQIRASSDVDARADVWSLGAILYELIAGRPAFGGNTVANVTAQVLEREPAPLSALVPSVPVELARVVQAALCKNADERYIDVAAFAAAVEPFAGPAGAGAAARAANILRGALRPDPITTPPVARDDALGGTVRFDKNRRKRLVGALVGGLAFVSLVLVSLAFATYRSTSSASTAVTLARRGIRSVVSKSVGGLAEEKGPSLASGAPIASVTASAATPSALPTASAPAPSTTGDVRAPPSATPTGYATTLNRGAPRQGIPASLPPPPLRASTAIAPSPPPPSPAPPPASTAPYNPFSERN